MWFTSKPKATTETTNHLSSYRQNTGVFLFCKIFRFGPQTNAKATTEYRVQTTETCGGWAENCKDKRANFNIYGGW